jgi:uncharacterized damage-inducible protein DinB
MKDHFIQLIQYEQWANDAIIVSIEKCIEHDERALLLLSHIMSVQTIWLNRIKNEPIITPLFIERSLPECKSLQITNTELWLTYLSSIENIDINQKIDFEFHGELKSISLLNAMTHLTSHATYHRGQIIARLKPYLDKIPLTTYVSFASNYQ